MPRPASAPAISWSLRGFPGSSDSTIVLIRSRTDSEETTPEPPLWGIPLWKKNFNSKTPCGVNAYLLEVARLTVDWCMPISEATSRSTSGLRRATPWSRNSRWKPKMLSLTRYRVCWRQWTLLINHMAARTLASRYSLALRASSPFSRASRRTSGLTRKGGTPSSFRETAYSPPTFWTTTSGMMARTSPSSNPRAGLGSRQAMRRAASTTWSRLAPRPSAILSYCRYSNSCRWRATMRAARPSSIPALRSCASRHSRRSRAATPTGSKDWTRARTSSTAPGAARATSPTSSTDASR